VERNEGGSTAHDEKKCDTYAVAHMWKQGVESHSWNLSDCYMPRFYGRLFCIYQTANRKSKHTKSSGCPLISEYYGGR
jgi:hypothetical protein